MSIISDVSLGACVADSGGYISRLSCVSGEAMLQSNDLCKRAPLPQCVLCLVTQSCPPGSSAHGDSPGKNTGVGCHAFLQGIFPIQGSNPGLFTIRATRKLLPQYYRIIGTTGFFDKLRYVKEILFLEMLFFSYKFSLQIFCPKDHCTHPSCSVMQPLFASNSNICNMYIYL